MTQARPDREKIVESKLREEIWQPLLSSDERWSNLAIAFGFLIFPSPMLVLRLYLERDWWEVLLLGVIAGLALAMVVPFILSTWTNSRAIDRAAKRFGRLFPPESSDYDLACDILAGHDNNKEVIQKFKECMMIDNQAPGPATPPQAQVLAGLDLAASQETSAAADTPASKPDRPEAGGQPRRMPLEFDLPNQTTSDEGDRKNPGKQRT